MQLNPFRKSYRRRLANKRALHQLQRDADHFFTVQYAKNMRSELSGLCQKHGTDKGAISVADHPNDRVHNYADFYEIIFGGMRRQVEHVLECGILRGESLRVWREYFPNATVTGVDIDESRLLGEDRIETYQVDQTDPASIKRFLEEVENRKFNIIIDDGLHTPEAGIIFFENMINSLTDDGIYIVEDVKPIGLFHFSQYFARYSDKYHARFVSLHRPHKSLGDNSLVLITRNA